MGQYVDALQCGALRHKHSGVSSRRTWNRVSRMYTKMVGAIVRWDFTTWFHDDPRSEATPTATREASFRHFFHAHVFDVPMKEACLGMDAVVINFGIHYNHRHPGDEIELYASDIANLADILRNRCKGVRKIIMGTTAQHFLSRGGYFPGNGELGKSAFMDYFSKANMTREYDTVAKASPAAVKSIERTVGCGKFRFDDKKDWRDEVALRELRKGFSDVRILSLTQGRERLCAPVKDLEETVWFVPVADRMRALHHQHGWDCTHYCMAPNTFDVQNDGLARALADAFSTCDDVNKRRADQGWDDELGYSMFGKNVKEGGLGTLIPELETCDNGIYQLQGCPTRKPTARMG